MKTLRQLSSLALVSGALFLNPPAYANEVFVDFENQPLLASTSRLEINTPHLTITISRPGATFGIVNPLDETFGLRTLAPFPNVSGRNFVADFSEPVKSVSFDIGDTSADQDTLFVTAYSDTGAQGDALKTETSICCSEVGFSTGTVTVSAPGIKSILFRAGSFFEPNSVFYDNFTLALENQQSDQDNDGISDDEDRCKDSDLRMSVIIDGCDSEIPNVTWFHTGCTTSDYITACANNAKNHGHFVKCVRRFTKTFEDNGLLNKGDKGSLQSCAAQAKLP